MGKHKLTKRLIETAVDMKSHGMNDCDIAAAIGVTKQTFSTWINHPETKLQRELGEQLKKEESAYKEQLLETIRAAAIAKNSNWTAAAWLLERKYPDEYSQNRQLANAESEKAPKIFLGVQVQPAGAKALAGASLDGKALLAGAQVDGQVEIVEARPAESGQGATSSLPESVVVEAGSCVDRADGELP